MALNNVSELSETPASNPDLAGISILGTGLVSTADDSFRTAASFLKKWWDDLGGVNTVAGTGDAITVTTLTVYTTLKTGMRLLWVQGASANTTAVTLNLDAIGAKAVRKISGGVDVALVAGDLPAGARIEAVYSTAANAAAGGWVIIAISSTPPTLVSLGAASATQLLSSVNLDIECSVGSSALTIALKGVNGSDPSASNPVYIPFRNVTAAMGAPAYLTATAATSLVISSGSTVGAPTGSVAFNVYVVAFNDAGTLRLGAILCTTLASNVLTQYPLAAWGIASSTAEGGAGAADSAQTFYTGAAVTSKAYTVLAVLRYESGLATAGTWASAPTRVQLFDPSVPLPGRVVQTARTQTGASTTGSTAVPADDTIPQNTEGDQFMSLAITPSSAGNILAVTASTELANTGVNVLVAALFQDSTANAFAVTGGTEFSANNINTFAVAGALIAGTTSATTIKARCGANAGTTTFNGASGARIFGGALASFIRIEEIAA